MYYIFLLYVAHGFIDRSDVEGFFCSSKTVFAALSGLVTFVFSRERAGFHGFCVVIFWQETQWFRFLKFSSFNRKLMEVLIQKWAWFAKKLINLSSQFSRHWNYQWGQIGGCKHAPVPLGNISAPLGNIEKRKSTPLGKSQILLLSGKF